MLVVYALLGGSCNGQGREAMAQEMRGSKIGGEDEVAEVDSGYFGGYVRLRNCARIGKTAAAGRTS